MLNLYSNYKSTQSLTIFEIEIKKLKIHFVFVSTCGRFYYCYVRMDVYESVNDVDCVRV